MKQIGLDQIAIKYLDSVQDKKAHAAFLLDDLLHHTYRSKTNLASFYYCYESSGIENKREFIRVKRLYEQSLEKKDTVIANYMLGRLYYDKGEYRKSYKYFSHAFQLKRKPEILFNMGAALFEMGESKRALDIFKKLGNIKSISCRDEALAATVVVLSSMKEQDEALSAFMAFIERVNWHITRVMEYALLCGDNEFVVVNCLTLAKSDEISPELFKKIFEVLKQEKEVEMCNAFIEHAVIAASVQEQKKHQIELCYLAEFFY